jgi:stearoyl-CoA desaturase (delta-9 desaturase)
LETIFFSGAVDLPWWGIIAVALVLTHITIASVTIFLHRHQAHHALALHPVASHFFRFWLWLTTGMVTREWAAIHRKHHAKCDTPEDPHSPQVLGINRVLWGGVFLYVKEAHRIETLERYGHGTPDDWLERNLYARYQSLGLILMGVVDVALFGLVPGLLVVLTQIVWIPFWAAGVVNGIGHYWGYRHWSTPDASTNIFPVGILIGGEELHNNHHAYPTSAKLSCKWYEFDIGWLYIRLLAALRLAQVKHVMPTPHLAAPKPAVDLQTLQAVIACRYDVLAKYAKSLKHIYAEEIAKLRRVAPQDARALERLKPKLLVRDEKMLHESDRARLSAALPKSGTLQTMYAMRRELAAVWGRSTATREQLVKQLQDWCQRAEASGIRSLAEFSQHLRRYA